jgi:hypothetical protein
MYEEKIILGQQFVRISRASVKGLDARNAQRPEERDRW